MWVHWLQRLNDQFPGLCNPWLTRVEPMWPQSTGASLSRVLTCGLGDADVCCLGMHMWLIGGARTSAAVDTGACCLVMLELVCSLMMLEQMLLYAASVAGSSVIISYLPRSVVRRPEVILRRLSEVTSEKGCLNERAMVVPILVYVLLYAASVAGSSLIISYLPRSVVRRPEVILKRLSEVTSEKGCLNERAMVVPILVYVLPKMVVVGS